MFSSNIKISQFDPELWNAIQHEKVRQENHIELIASENYVTNCVMEAQGSILTNKYAEGYPNKRYYGGCEYIDIIESIAIKRAKSLFKCNYANVQPHSGSQANFAVYQALLSPGDIILGMNLSHGGHLTHGSKVNFSGKIYKSVSYNLNDNEKIDYNQILLLAKKYKPKIIVGGFSAYSGICDWKKMREIANEVNAYLLVDMAHIAGLVACGLYPNPVFHAHVVTTTTHKTLSGPRGGLILSNENDIELYKKINSSVFPGIQGGPLIHVIAAKAICFKEAQEPSFICYQKQVLKNSKYMSNIFINNKFHVISGISQNHLFLINLTRQNLTGQEACIRLDKVNITVNKNSVPNDQCSSFITSGIRIGTPAVTRRGFKEPEIEQLAYLIIEILNSCCNFKKINLIKEKVLFLCKKFPVYNTIL